MDFTHQRNADLMRAFRHHLALAGYVIMPEIFARVAASPSSRFWVSEERATVVISAMLAGKPLPRMRHNKREMFAEIYRRVIIMRRQHPDKTLQEIVSLVISQPAPCFYLTPRTVGEIIYLIKKGWYDANSETIRSHQ